MTGYVHTTILCCSKHEINTYCFSRTTVSSGEGEEDEEEGEGEIMVMRHRFTRPTSDAQVRR